VLLWDFLPCKAVYDNIIYRYKYVTVFLTIGIKLLIIETKETVVIPAILTPLNTLEVPSAYSLPFQVDALLFKV
jgi:hypothetical protein